MSAFLPLIPRWLQRHPAVPSDHAGRPAPSHSNEIAGGQKNRKSAEKNEKVRKKACESVELVMVTIPDETVRLEKVH